MEIVNNKTERPLAHYRDLFAAADPVKMAAQSCADYSEQTKKFTVMVLGHPFFVSWPDASFLTTPIYFAPKEKTVSEIDAHSTASAIARQANAQAEAAEHGNLMVPIISPELTILLLRILLEGSAMPAKTHFIAYQEIPKGAAYLPAFNRRCTQRLAKQFEEADQLAEACQAMGASPIDSKADTAWQFEFLPGLFVQFLFWEGDDEFPAQSQILFSNNITSFFSSEDAVVIAEIIIRAISQGYVS